MRKAHHATVTIGEALTAELARRGHTHRAAAAEMGVEQSAVTRWANDTSVPKTVDHLSSLRAYLRMDELQFGASYVRSVEQAAEAKTRRRSPASR